MKQTHEKVQKAYKTNRAQWKRIRRAAISLYTCHRLLCLVVLLLFPLALVISTMRGAYYYAEEFVALVLGIIHPKLAAHFMGGFPDGSDVS